ncbi:hypothetical protein AJ80_04659 [Polytolypa hystricis UAMH7299]|uniref:Rhodopsin domain-containing protein n=1 Tax=Polytolypa hystricis (strain UAMH7299) TaxID=1447883 RepID=A0A2B7Y8K0_POLH7|nr:hypothetical protein AJ80_04659 [Polytolypa hystricis UAMH7299]
MGVYFFEGNRHSTTTENNHGAYIQIASWFVAVVMILMTGLRLAIRFRTTRNPGLDDAVCGLGLFFGLCGTVSKSYAVNYGLGQSSAVRDLSQQPKMQIALYTSAMFYVATLFLGKLVVILILIRLTVAKAHLLLLRLSLAVAALWAVGGILTAAFQCRLPYPWKYSKDQCINYMAYWATQGAFDMLTDAVIMAVSLWILSNVQMTFSKRLVVVIAAAAIRIALRRQAEDSSDLFFAMVPFQIATQCHAACSIVIASFPILKPFVSTTATGMLEVSMAKRGGTTYDYTSRRNSGTSVVTEVTARSDKGNRYSRASYGSHPETLSTSQSDGMATGVNYSNQGVVDAEWFPLAETKHHIDIEAGPSPPPQAHIRQEIKPRYSPLVGDGDSFHSSRPVSPITHREANWPLLDHPRGTDGADIVPAGTASEGPFTTSTRVRPADSWI